MSTEQKQDLTPQSLAESYKPVTTEIPDVCATGDKECVARLVQAFGDCD